LLTRGIILTPMTIEAAYEHCRIVTATHACGNPCLHVLLCFALSEQAKANCLLCGLRLLPIRRFGYVDRNGDSRAVDLGIAMQLTNILRDIGEDVANNRIYLSLEELEAYRLAKWKLIEGKITPSFREFIRFQIDRARRYSASANLGIPLLEPEGRLTVKLMSHNYSGILNAIERNNYDVFSKHAFVPFPRKFLSIPQLWLERVTL